MSWCLSEGCEHTDINILLYIEIQVSQPHQMAGCGKQATQRSTSQTLWGQIWDPVILHKLLYVMSTTGIPTVAC